MYEHILLSTHRSELSGHAVKEAILLAQALKARLTAITVTAPFAGFDATRLDSPETYEMRAAALAQNHLDYVSEAAKLAGVECETVRVIDKHPYQAIIATAAEKKCNLISIDALCSETIKVVAHSHLPVLIHAQNHVMVSRAPFLAE